QPPAHAGARSSAGRPAVRRESTTPGCPVLRCAIGPPSWSPALPGRRAARRPTRALRRGLLRGGLLRGRLLGSCLLRGRLPWRSGLLRCALLGRGLLRGRGRALLGRSLLGRAPARGGALATARRLRGRSPGTPPRAVLIGVLVPFVATGILVGAFVKVVV